jgi:uncharacterized protein YjiS (DUF1127 family)
MNALSSDRITERPALYVLEHQARLQRAAAMAGLFTTLFLAIERGASRVAGAFRRWLEIQDTIADLERLDDRCLADIGIEREEIQAFVTGHQARHDADGHLYVAGAAPVAANAPRATGVAA